MTMTATEVKSGETVLSGDFDKLCDTLAKAEASFKELADALLAGHLSKSGVVPRDDTMWLMLLAGESVGLMQKARAELQRAYLPEA